MTQPNSDAWMGTVTVVGGHDADCICEQCEYTGRCKRMQTAINEKAERERKIAEHQDSQRTRAAELLAAVIQPPSPIIGDQATSDRLSTALASKAAPAEDTPRSMAETFAHCFRGQANHLAMQFGGPLYLFGSMLTSLTPGDIDVRLCIDRADLACWFGDDNLDCTVPWGASSYLRTREELKQSRRMTRRWCRVKRVSRPWRWAPRIDFQFVISLMSDADGLPIFGDDTRPRLRLDDVPVAYFAAGRNEP